VDETTLAGTKEPTFEHQIYTKTDFTNLGIKIE